MNDTRRLLEDPDPMTRAMLEAAASDGPSDHAQRRAWSALGLGPLVVASAGAAATATLAAASTATASATTAAAASTPSVAGAAAAAGAVASSTAGAAVGGASAAGGGAGAAVAGVASGTAAAGKWLAIALAVGGASGGYAYVSNPSASTTETVVVRAATAAAPPAVRGLAPPRATHVARDPLADLPFTPTADEPAAAIADTKDAVEPPTAPTATAPHGDPAATPTAPANETNDSTALATAEAPPVPANPSQGTSPVVSPAASLVASPGASSGASSGASPIASPAAPSVGPTARAASTLTRETAALDVASGALRDNQPTRALVALDDFARRFPGGALAPEATVLRIDALTRLGNPSSRASADRLADTFLHEHPRSPLAKRVRALVHREESR